MLRPSSVNSIRRRCSPDLSHSNLNTAALTEAHDSAGRITSALGQKPTFPWFARCPLFPRKRTSAERVERCASGHNQTHAFQQTGPLFDHLVGKRQQYRRNG